MQAPPAPGTGDKIDYAKLLGALLHITVREVARDIQTVHGVSDAVRADVAVLDGPSKGEELNDVLIFPKVLQGQLSKFAGAKDPAIIGRLGQGQASPGKSAPWQLHEPTEADMTIGAKYEAYVAQREAEQEAPF